MYTALFSISTGVRSTSRSVCTFGESCAEDASSSGTGSPTPACADTPPSSTRKADRCSLIQSQAGCTLRVGYLNGSNLKPDGCLPRNFCAERSQTGASSPYGRLGGAVQWFGFYAADGGGVGVAGAQDGLDEVVGEGFGEFEVTVDGHR